jgi:hypothetical protein
MSSTDTRCLFTACPQHCHRGCECLKEHAPLQAILHASHLVSLGVLTPKFQRPLRLPVHHSAIRLCLVCLYFYLLVAAKLPFRLFERMCPGPVSVPARAMDWMQKKAACISIDWPVRSCMMQRDGCCDSTCLGPWPINITRPSSFCKNVPATERQVRSGTLH